ncbi:hypothetical protein PVAR5_3786 [Paecilomyces variotii No. 5]|uniref:Uncharacterized protein n=1 Tax=Byssochlamys spectabilis (strain No. 5 / NBRC 109023) TaxID=1356009 RepID=V5G2Q6_BYSSN|nr:hypothetical protein PVAR5_3786 [Paecilomyces variotii No. 5]
MCNYVLVNDSATEPLRLFYVDKQSLLHARLLSHGRPDPDPLSTTFVTTQESSLTPIQGDGVSVPRMNLPRSAALGRPLPLPETLVTSQSFRALPPGPVSEPRDVAYVSQHQKTPIDITIIVPRPRTRERMQRDETAFWANQQ